MPRLEYLEYHVTVGRDEGTNQVIALVPLLDIGDFGRDAEQARNRLHKMVVFHLKSLVTEG